MRRSMWSTAVTSPNRLVTPRISTSGADPATAATGAVAMPAGRSAGASGVREAVNGGPRAVVPVVARRRCSGATEWLHPRGASRRTSTRVVCESRSGSATIRAGLVQDCTYTSVAACRDAADRDPEDTDIATELQLGGRIRALRQARRLTLRDVAERSGVTESFLSQVERDVTSPSIATVQRIARALDMSIAQLFAEEPQTGRVVRREARRRVEYQGLKAVDEFLTSNMAGRLQVILSTIESGGGTGADPYTHDSDEEVVVVLAGVLDLWVGDEHYVLREGDAITFPSRLPHWNVNHGDRPASVLFCVTPPSF